MLTAYVVVGGLLVAYLSFSVAADVARYHRVLTAMAKANVPESWLTTLAALKAAGGNPRYTEFPQKGHSIGQPTLSPDTLDWLFSQERTP